MEGSGDVDTKEGRVMCGRDGGDQQAETARDCRPHGPSSLVDVGPWGRGQH